MVNEYILLNDGSSHILLNDGSSAVILNDTGAAPAPTGVVISGTHARPLLVTGRKKQIIPIEFTFWLKSELIRKTKKKVKIQSTLLTRVESKLDIKATLIKPVYEICKVKAPIVIPSKKTIVSIKSSISYPISETFTLIAKLSNPKLKRVLLKKLKEMLDD